MTPLDDRQPERPMPRRRPGTSRVSTSRPTRRRSSARACARASRTTTAGARRTGTCRRSTGTDPLDDQLRHRHDVPELEPRPDRPTGSSRRTSSSAPAPGYYTSDVHSFGDPDGAAVHLHAPATSAIVPGVAVPTLQHATGFASVPTNTSTARDQQTRLTFQVDATWYGNLGGQHTIKGGVAARPRRQRRAVGRAGQPRDPATGASHLQPATGTRAPTATTGSAATARTPSWGSSPRAMSPRTTSGCSSRTPGRSTTS